MKGGLRSSLLMASGVLELVSEHFRLSKIDSGLFKAVTPATVNLEQDWIRK